MSDAVATGREGSLKQSLARIAKEVRSTRAVLDDEPWPRAMIIGVDTPERAEELRKKWGVVGIVWLPPHEEEPPGLAEENAYWEARQKLEGGA